MAKASGRSQFRVPVVAAGMAILALVVGIVAVVTRPSAVEDVAKSATAPSTSQEPSVVAATPTKAKAAVADEPPAVLPLSLKTTNPRPRPVAKIEPLAIEPSPLAFAAAPRPKPFSEAVDQEKVDRAIRLGKEYLINNQGAWLNQQGSLGYAALPGLALMESGVGADEPVIVTAATAVRRLAPRSTETYHIALAILFLDRLGDPADEALIRTLALRLVAGQTPRWGWDYSCPNITPELETPFLTMLEKLRPEGRWQTPLPREPGQGLVEFAIPLASADRVSLGKPLGAEPIKRESAPAKTPDLVMPMVLRDEATTRNLVKGFPDVLQALPIARPMDELPDPRGPAPKTKGKAKVRRIVAGVRDDNSNTQFAMLALWTARRHGIPVDRSLLLADSRFAKSQGPDGAWGYHYDQPAGGPSMTCVGLLGLALGHGALLPDARDATQPPPPRIGADPAIAKGLAALSKVIGDPAAPGPSANNLYFLWSLERVAMMYQLKTIGGKDWYGWGANHLIASQTAKGGWPTSGYPGSNPAIDTSFALLFLHRSNLVPDLTERLQLHMPISDHQRR